MAKNIIDLGKAGKAVPQSKRGSLNNMNKEMARTNKEPKAEKAKAKATAGKKGKSEPEADLFKSVKNSASSKDEALPGMSALPNKGRKRRKTMLDDNELDFKATKAPMKAAPIVLATPRPDEKYEQVNKLLDWLDHSPVCSLHPSIYTSIY